MCLPHRMVANQVVQMKLTVRVPAELPIQDFVLGAEAVAQHQQAVSRALPKISSATLSKTYVGFLGFYNSQGSLKWSKGHLVDVANEFSAILGVASLSNVAETARPPSGPIPTLQSGIPSPDPP